MEERGRRALVLSAIVIAHGFAFVALATTRLRVDSEYSAPLVVDFISEPVAPPQWQPPPITPVTVVTRTDMPAVPLFDTSSENVPDRAISVVPLVTTAANLDRATPRFVSTVEYLREPVPRYPPQSRRLREQGLVVLRVLIDEKGMACSIEIESSSGHERLDHAAREAVERAEFRPYVEDGAPRRALVLIPIEFALNRSSA